jgi:hypothetical protein
MRMPWHFKKEFWKKPLPILKDAKNKKLKKSKNAKLLEITGHKKKNLELLNSI